MQSFRKLAILSRSVASRLLALLLFFAALAPAVAAPLVNGGKVSGTIVNDAQQDVWTFTAAAGTNVILQLVNTGDFRLAPQMALYDPAGNLVDRENDMGMVRIEHSPQLSGTFKVVVSSWPGYGVGPYDLHFVGAPGANELGALVNGGDLHAVIEDTGDLDSYTFFANAGDWVILQVVKFDSTLAPRLSVYDPAGVRLFQRSDTGRVRFDTPISTTGVHTVVISHDSIFVGSPGEFALHYVRAPGATEYGSLVSGGTRFGDIDFGDLDSWNFYADAGESIHLALFDESIDREFTPRMDLIMPNGSRWGSKPDQTGVTFNLSAPLAGTYTVVASHDSAYGGIGGPYSLALTLSNDRVSYAALGDSFSSGESVTPFRDPDPPNSGCHRATRAYPALLHAADDRVPFSERHDARFDFFACSGAISANVSATGPGQFEEPPQLSIWNAVDASRDLITLSIGGNDAQFADIAKYCLLHPDCNGLKPFQPYSDITLGDFSPLLLRFVQTEVEAAHDRVRAAAPNATVLVFGYPILLNGSECAEASLPPFPELKISASEQAYLRRFNAQLNAVVQQSALAHGFHWVPVAGRFVGHEVCSANPWINGVTYYPSVFSFHPTLAGQQAYADAGNATLQSIGFGVRRADGTYRVPGPRVPASKPAPIRAAVAALPSFGSLSATLATLPAGCRAAVAVGAPGRPERLTGAGFAPGEAVTLSIAVGGQVTPLGVALADGAGLLDVILTLPGGLPDEVPASIDALGGGLNGKGRLLTGFVRLSSSALADSDGDGIADACDTCTRLSNADQRDTNRDGYGNRCDADIDDSGFVDDRDGRRMQLSAGLIDDGLDADLNGDRAVDAKDARIFRQSQGKPPGPSAREVLSGSR